MCFAARLPNVSSYMFLATYAWSQMPGVIYLTKVRLTASILNKPCLTLLFQYEVKRDS